MTGGGAVNLEWAVKEARFALRGGASFDRVALVYGRAVARMALVYAASPTPPAAPPRPVATSDRHGR